MRNAVTDPHSRSYPNATLLSLFLTPSRSTAHGLLATLLGVTLSGCASMAPSPPELAPPVPTQWPAALQAAPGAVDAPAWDSYFNDPTLRQLIATALSNNRDLRLALLQVEQARAAFRIQRAEQFPGLGVSSQAARSRVPGDLNTSGTSVVGAEYRAELGLASWELDLWGRVRDLKQSALQQWLATEAGARAAQLSLIAQVADGYLAVREMDERVALARRAVDSRQESFRIFSRRAEVGASSRLELTQVQTLLTQSQALLAQLEQSRATRIHALGQLVGADPGPLPASVPFDQAMTLAPLPAGLPSDLLHARPDILAAEHQLLADNANIGAARAAFFPRIALTGSWGSASAELNGLFDSGSHAWTFMPTLSLPLFDGGRRRANLKLAEVRRDMAVAQYEKAIQSAFRETADALAARRWLQEQLDLQHTALVTTQERARLAQLRYDSGSATYLEVLDAQRDLLSTEQQWVQVRRSLLSSQIALYAALGGSRMTTSSSL